MKRKSCTIRATQPEHPSDCVTATRMGGGVLKVKDCGRPDAKETAEDTMARLLVSTIEICHDVTYTDTS